MTQLPSTPRPSARSLRTRCALALIALSLAACTEQRAGAAEAEVPGGARPRSAARVRVEAVQRREMVQWLETTCVVESELEIEVFPRASGRVLEVLAEEGDRVAAQAPLLRLESETESLALREARVAVEEARDAERKLGVALEEAAAGIETSRLAAEQTERDYQRDLRLWEQKTVASGVSDKALEASRLARDNAVQAQTQARLALERARLEVENARTAVVRAQVGLERAELALDYTVLRAPFGGVVARRSVRVGDSVGPGAAVFTLTDPERLRAVFFRPQRELSLFARASAGGEHGTARLLALEATAEALPGLLFSGEVVRSSPTIDPASGSFRVTARLDNPPAAREGERLLPGMLVRLRIATDRHPDALVVPKRSLQREGDRIHVLCVRENRVVKVLVEEGFADDDWVEILARDGARLEAGELVVLVGNRDLEEGAEVEIEGDAEGEIEGDAEGEIEGDAEGAIDAAPLGDAAQDS